MRPPPIPSPSLLPKGITSNNKTMAVPSATNAEFSSPIKVGISAVYSGDGVPNFAATTSSLFLRTNATTSATRLYIHTGATWTAFTAAA